MTFEFSEKANQIKEGIFAVLNTKKNEMEAHGKKTYNLSVGTSINSGSSVSAYL